MEFRSVNQRILNAGALAGIALFAFVITEVLFGPFPKVRSLLQQPLAIIVLMAIFWIASPFVSEIQRKTPEFNMLWVLALGLSSISAALLIAWALA